MPKFRIFLKFCIGHETEPHAAHAITALQQFAVFRRGRHSAI